MLSEKEFLISLAIAQFNRQYGKFLKITDCDIKSIPLRYAATRSYEVFTLRSDDFVRMNIHMSFGGLDEVYPYTLEVDSTDGRGILIDEVYVASGIIDNYYIDSGTYTFRVLNADTNLLDILTLEDGTSFLLETGENILLENGF